MSRSPAGQDLSFIQASGAGVIISVVLKPRSRRNAIEGTSQEGLLKVRVTAPPVKGAANEGLVRLLSRSMRVPVSRLSIISGQTSTRKRVLVEGLSAEDAREWWQGIAASQKTT